MSRAWSCEGSEADGVCAYPDCDCPRKPNDAAPADAAPGWMLEAAWGIIANAYGGAWELATSSWRRAAERWRDAYHRTLDAASAPRGRADSGTVERLLAHLAEEARWRRLLAIRDPEMAPAHIERADALDEAAVTLRHFGGRADADVEEALDRLTDMLDAHANHSDAYTPSSTWPLTVGDLRALRRALGAPRTTEET